MSATKHPIWSKLNLIALFLFVFAPLILYPFASLLGYAFTYNGKVSVDGFVGFFTSPTTMAILEASLKILVISGVLASLTGIMIAAVIYFFPFKGSGSLVRFMELFVSFPSFLVAFTLIFQYGDEGSINILLKEIFGLEQAPLSFLFGIGGVVLAQVIYYTPFIVRPALNSLMRIDPAAIEAAKTLGAPPSMVAREVIMPQATAGIFAGVILCFLLTLNEFGILLVLASAQLVTLPVSIYSEATINLDLNAAAVQAVIMLVMSVCLYMVYRWFAHRAGEA